MIIFIFKRSRAKHLIIKGVFKKCQGARVFLDKAEKPVIRNQSEIILRRYE